MPTTYQLVYRQSVKKQLKKLPKKDLKAIVSKVLKLAENPRPLGYTKLRGTDDLYRIRQGDYRVIYQIKDKKLIIIIIKIGHRKEAYR